MTDIFDNAKNKKGSSSGTATTENPEAGKKDIPSEGEYVNHEETQPETSSPPDIESAMKNSSLPVLSKREAIMSQALDKLSEMPDEEIMALMDIELDPKVALEKFKESLDLEFKKFEHWKRSLIKMTKDAPEVWTQWSPDAQIASFTGDAQSLMSGPNGKFIPIRIKCDPKEDVIWKEFKIDGKVFHSVTAYVSGWEKDRDGNMIEDTLIIKSAEKSTVNSFWSTFEGKVQEGNYVKLIKGKDMENAAITSAVKLVFGQVAGVKKVPLKVLEECGIDLEKITRAYANSNKPASEKQLKFMMNIAKRIIKKAEIKELENLILNTDEPITGKAAKTIIEKTKDLSDNSMDQPEYIKNFKKYIG